MRERASSSRHHTCSGREPEESVQRAQDEPTDRSLDPLEVTRADQASSMLPSERSQLVTEPHETQVVGLEGSRVAGQLDGSSRLGIFQGEVSFEASGRGVELFLSEHMDERELVLCGTQACERGEHGPGIEEVTDHHQDAGTRTASSYPVEGGREAHDARGTNLVEGAKQRT